jgi:hypothetical protein
MCFRGFSRKSPPFILCNDYAKPAANSAMLAPNEKIIGKWFFNRRRKSGEPSPKQAGVFQGNFQQRPFG